MRAFNLDIPSSHRKITTAGSAAQSTLHTVGNKPHSTSTQVLPQFGLVRAGSGQLTVKYPKDDAGIRQTVATGDYIPGGCESVDADGDDADIEIMFYY